jgi:hypothetical protein
MLAMFRKLCGGAFVLLGVAVFLVRLQHEGPYFFPEGGNLAGGLGALACGVALLFTNPVPTLVGRLTTSALAAVSIIALYLASYATAAELEEVIVVRTSCAAGEGEELRLWLVDEGDQMLVSMSRAKAERSQLTSTKEVSLLRGGAVRCVAAEIVSDATTLRRVTAGLYEKYTVARIATDLGIFSDDRLGTNVVLRMTETSTPQAPH